MFIRVIARAFARLVSAIEFDSVPARLVCPARFRIPLASVSDGRMGNVSGLQPNGRSSGIVGTPPIPNRG